MVSDRIFSCIWLGVCALIAVMIWRLNVPFAYEPVGPKAFPLLLALLMALCCFALIVKPERGVEIPELSALGKGALVILILLGYALSFEQLGFPLATLLMVPLISRLFGGRWMWGMVCGLVVSILGYFIFDGLLQVTLPLGRFWGW